MDTPKVRHVKEFTSKGSMIDLPPDVVYIGRGHYTNWGNPFVIGKDGSREEVIQKFEDWLLSQPEKVLKAKTELKGKDLVCFCAPLACHGDVYLRIVNE